MRTVFKGTSVSRFAKLALPAIAAAMTVSVVSSIAQVPDAVAAKVPQPAATASAATASAAKAAAPVTKAAFLHPKTLYYGVSTPGLPRDTRKLRAFSAAAGKSPNMVLYFQSWSQNFDVTGLRKLSKSRRLPVVSWEPWNYRKPKANPYPLKSISAGKYDRYLRKQARLVKSANVVIAIRLAHEMNGDWYPWGQGVNRNTYAGYVRMHRHVHDVFRKEGVRNVIWIWSPNLVDPRPKVSIAKLYPGDKYVDWVGVVGYLRGSDPYYTYAQVYRKTLARLNTFGRTKPILITETSVQRSVNRAAKIHDLIRGIRSTRRVIGLVWFEHDAGLDWRVVGDRAASAALRAEIASSRFGHS
jgi:hypothetical protein